MKTPVGGWRVTWHEGAGLRRHTKSVPEPSPSGGFCRQQGEGLYNRMAAGEWLTDTWAALGMASKVPRACREVRPSVGRSFILQLGSWCLFLVPSVGIVLGVVLYFGLRFKPKNRLWLAREIWRPQNMPKGHKEFWALPGVMIQTGWNQENQNLSWERNNRVSLKPGRTQDRAQEGWNQGQGPSAWEGAMWGWSRVSCSEPRPPTRAERPKEAWPENDWPITTTRHRWKEAMISL